MKILDRSSKTKIVRESYEEGCTVASLAKKYGVSTSAIHRWRQSSSGEEKIKDNELVEDDIMTMLYGARDVKETVYEVNAFG